MTDRALEMLHLRDHDSALEAAFVPGAGMLCCSLRHRGHELLAQNAGVAAYAEHGKTMGIPLLYPWANRLAGFDYTAAGRHVQVPHDPSRVRLDAGGLPIHGVVGGRLAWELAGAGDEDSGAGDMGAGDSGAGNSGALVATLSWSDAHPELFEVFPFRHELRYEARLGGGRLEVEVSVHACGEDAVPLAFGFHPYLVPSGGGLPADDASSPDSALPAGAGRKQWLVELPAMRALELDVSQIPVGPGRELAAERFELGDRMLDDGFDSVVEPARFSVEGGGRRIEVTFACGYPCAQVFAPAGGQFICFEPMTAPANALRSGDGLRLLAPGERFAARFTVAVDTDLYATVKEWRGSPASIR
jgi:aldose 1-epimerase